MFGIINGDNLVIFKCREFPGRFTKTIASIFTKNSNALPFLMAFRLSFKMIYRGVAYKDGPEIWVARPLVSFLFCFCRARPIRAVHNFLARPLMQQKCFLARPYMRPLYSSFKKSFNLLYKKSRPPKKRRQCGQRWIGFAIGESMPGEDSEVRISSTLSWFSGRLWFYEILVKSKKKIIKILRCHKKLQIRGLCKFAKKGTN